MLAPLRTSVPPPTLIRLRGSRCETGPLMVSVLPGSTPTLWSPAPLCSRNPPPQVLSPPTLRNAGLSFAGAPGQVDGFAGRDVHPAVQFDHGRRVGYVEVAAHRRPVAPQADHAAVDVHPAAGGIVAVEDQACRRRLSRIARPPSPCR